MIELTDEQILLLQSVEGGAPRACNPRTKETYVLLRIEDYERLTAPEYDDSPWTREELETLAWGAGKGIGWEEMDEYDQQPEQS